MKDTVKNSSQYNNCAFHTIVPELTKNLSSRQFKQTSGYRYFREAFAEYYHLEDNQELDMHITSTCSKVSHPLDLQVLLGPVLRLTLKRVLTHNEEYKCIMQEVFKGLVIQCKEEYAKLIFHGGEEEFESLNEIIYFLNRLNLNKDEQSPLFRANIKRIAEILFENKFIEPLLEEAYQAYIDYIGDLGVCSFISFDELSLLCHSFNFECKNVDHKVKEDQESKSRIEDPFATVFIKNEEGNHWERASEDILSSSQSVFSEYHDLSCHIQSLHVEGRYLNTVQSFFRKKINQVIINKKEYVEEIYTILPAHEWQSVNGFAPLVAILCQEITGEKQFTRKKSENEIEFLKESEAMTEFLLAYGKYYKLDKNMTIPNILLELKKLLRDYPLSKERLMIIGPVLERMHPVPVHYEKFNIALEIYVFSPESKKAYCYHRITSLYSNEECYFARAGLAFDGKKYQALDLNESDYLTFSFMIASYSLTNAFYFDKEMPESRQRKVLREEIKKYHKTSILYCHDRRKFSSGLQLSNPPSLHREIVLKKIGSVKDLIENGADWHEMVACSSIDLLKNKTLPKEMNALELATYLGDRAIVTLLLEQIDPEKEKEHIQSAYRIAYRFSQTAILVPFLRYSWLKDESPALYKAIISKDLELFDKLSSLEGKKECLFQHQDKLFEFSLDLYSAEKKYSLGLLEMFLYFKYQQPSGSELNRKIIEIVESAFARTSEGWVKHFLLTLQEIAFELRKKESE